MENSDFLKQAIGSFLRIFGAPIITWISTTLGLTPDTTSQVIVAVVAFVVAFIWSIANKFKVKEKIDTALELPAGSSPATLKDVIANK
jgi:hypothetical protein